jgi:outer membrane protein assembly factor BamB
VTRAFAWLTVAAMLAPLAGQSWPQWRGANRDGRSSETGLLARWPSGGPHVAWRAKGAGEGFSGLAVADGRIYTQGQSDGHEHVVALDAATGARVWLTQAGTPFQESAGNGPRGTPTVDGDRLYALAADGTLACLQSRSGATLWSENLVARFGGAIPRWGFSESPLVDGDRLIVQPGAPGAGIVALDKLTGRLRWKAEGGEAAYSSVISIVVGGVRQLIALQTQSLSALEADTGRILWRSSVLGNNPIATPVVHDGYLFASNFYAGVGVLLKLAPSAMAEVYSTRDMKNHYSSPVVVDGTLYGFNDAILTALDFATGRLAWRTRDVAKGSVVYADGHLYVLAEDGVMALIKATPRGYVEASRFEVDIGRRPAWCPFWTPPVIAGGRMFLRVQDHVLCYDIR